MYGLVTQAPRARKTTRARANHRERREAAPQDALSDPLLANTLSEPLAGQGVVQAKRLPPTPDEATEEAYQYYPYYDSLYEQNRRRGAAEMTRLPDRIAEADRTGGLTDDLNPAAVDPANMDRATKVNPVALRGRKRHWFDRRRTGFQDYYKTVTKGSTRLGGHDKVPEFKNWMAPEAGQIIADENFRRGTRSSNSEVIWNQWKTSVDRHRQRRGRRSTAAYSNLNEIVRNDIANDETCKVAYMCFSEGETNQERTFRPGSGEFNAMLWTPNCKSSYWMLAQHAHEMDKTGFDSIVVKMGGLISPTTARRPDVEGPKANPYAFDSTLDYKAPIPKVDYIKIRYR